MAIDVSCQECFYEFSVGNQYAGKSGRCPECGSPVMVPRRRSSDPRTGTQRRKKRTQETSTAAPISSRRRSSKGKQEEQGMSQFWMGVAIAGGATALLAIVAVVAFSLGGSSDDAQTDNPSGQLAATTQQPTNPPVQQPVTVPEPVTPPGTNPVVATTNNTTTPPTPVPVTPTEPKPEPEPPVAQPAPVQKSLADLIEEVEPSVVRIDTETSDGGGNGSGFVIDKEGTILTNYHVIAGAERATVVFSDGEKLPVTGILRLERNKDIAVIKVTAPPERFKAITLATELPRKGEQVLACGAPFGLSFTASEGIIAALRTSTEIKALGVNHDGDWIQTTAPISPGNSGGPLINRQGQVVAANTMQLTRGQNLNFGISSLDLQKAYDARSSKITPLNPSTAPAAKEEQSRRQKVVDATKDERGRKMLAAVDEVTLIIASFSFDPTGEINAYVKRMAEGSLKSADIKVTATQKALLLVTMQLERAGVAAGAKGLTISAHMLIRDTSAPGGVQVVKIWQDEEKVGTFPQSSLSRGRIPSRVRTQTTEFFQRFIADKKKAEEEFGN